MPLLAPDVIAGFLHEQTGWDHEDGTITKTFVFANFVEAMGFVTSVAILSEKAFHHPDIDIRWNKVTIALTTHDQGGLTDKDTALAVEIDAL
jgi:4a-hydroxytetrahydrobiopterin dehydratase